MTTDLSKSLYIAEANYGWASWHHGTIDSKTNKWRARTPKKSTWMQECKQRTKRKQNKNYAQERKEERKWRNKRSYSSRTTTDIHGFTNLPLVHLLSKIKLTSGPDIVTGERQSVPYEWDYSCQHPVHSLRPPALLLLWSNISGSQLLIWNASVEQRD